MIVELDELTELHSTAKLSEYRQAEMDRMKKENTDLAVECEKLAKGYNDLRCELSTRPTTRELQPVTKTAINNAKEALAAHYRPITSGDNLADETVPGDRFHAVYKTLSDLVSQLELEGLS